MVNKKIKQVTANIRELVLLREQLNTKDEK